jgi:hypothetical protein
MAGGQFDTLGYRSLPPLPDLPGADEHQQKLEADLHALPSDATRDDRRDVLDTHYNDAPSSADYASLFERADYKRAQKQRAKIIKENKEKQQRTAALNGGANINFRTDKCAGDPTSI